jgi:hypothetical protein
MGLATSIRWLTERTATPKGCGGCMDRQCLPRPSYSSEMRYTDSPDSFLEDTLGPQPLVFLLRGPYQQHRHHAIQREMPDELHPIEHRQ